jgi:hypothetical protein
MEKKILDIGLDGWMNGWMYTLYLILDTDRKEERESYLQFCEKSYTAGFEIKHYHWPK